MDFRSLSWAGLCSAGLIPHSHLAVAASKHAVSMVTCTYRHRITNHYTNERRDQKDRSQVMDCLYMRSVSYYTNQLQHTVRLLLITILTSFGRDTDGYTKQLVSLPILIKDFMT